MRLVDFDEDEDIAIFRANNDQHYDVRGPNRRLEVNELHVLPSTIHQTGPPCFAVAYSGEDLPVTVEWSDAMSKLNPINHAQIMKEHHPTHRCAYMLANYFAALRNSPAGKRMIEDIDKREIEVLRALP